MNKKFVSTSAIGVALLLTMCSSFALADDYQKPTESKIYQIPNNVEPLMFFEREKLTKPVTLLEYQQYTYKKNQEQKRLHQKTLKSNLSDLTVAIKNTEKYIDKTWYVFSGSTPQGWDCSGLVLWTYSHLGFELYHSATAQMNFGDKVKSPKYGDIVGFRQNNSSGYYHVGIYVSEDTMLHSGGKDGDRTELRSISGFAGNHSEIEYSRIVPTTD